MSEPTQRESRVDEVLYALQERAKELSCLYRIEEILGGNDKPLEEVFRALVEVIPPGWQHPAVCHAKLVYRGQAVHPPQFVETPWVLRAPIVVQGERVGSIDVYYAKPMPEADEGPFLKEERRLIDSIAERVAQFLLQRELTSVFSRIEAGERERSGGLRQDWSVVVDLLRRTDLNLFWRISRKMLNHLAFADVGAARALLKNAAALDGESDRAGRDENKPAPISPPGDRESLARETFRIAAAHFGDQEILSKIRVWIKEDRVRFLLLGLESSYTSLVDIANLIERYQLTGVDARDLSLATQMGLKAALIRRLLTEHIEFIDVCREHVSVEDFVDLVRHTIILPKSHGRLGGKSSGLFLAAQIVRRSREFADVLREVRVPKTWYLPSDGIIQFFAYNDLDDVYNWKYRDVAEIRQEYPHIQQVFKSSHFPPEIVNGLSAVLDDLGERPIIVRSSSLLEDRIGSAFSGKYKSLFLANQGAKAARLAALLDAVAEVYASVFGPDPIEYRAERGLLAQHEEMAVMIQEVVGTRIGRYFLPTFSGVALSNNDLRWSPRIRRDDGLLRLVPGLGTRAVDRLADDYPILVAPGQPGLRVNVTPDEVRRYSPKKVDLINLEANSFETVEFDALLREAGSAYPGLRNLVSLIDRDGVRRLGGLGLPLESAGLAFTFDGLLADTGFVTQMRALLKLLGESLGSPVEIEFASDGEHLYLLQCRPQGYADEDAPSPIPRDIPESQVLFSAHRYVSNGRVPDLTHIVYVDPDGYSEIGDADRLRDVGRAVGSLNRLLPKRQFVLMGPGRWGSRGDVRLGVSVSYADINNAALLVEIARAKGHYVPDLSFGTHFFQDLVESSIRYLPLYPDDPGVAFNEALLRGSANILEELAPEFAQLANVVRVIDVRRATDGRLLRVLMNAELDESLAFFAAPGTEPASPAGLQTQKGGPSEDHWRWRLRMVQRLAADLDAARFGVKGLYVFGSTKNGTAGPASDIDVLVHFSGSPEMRQQLEAWLEGWSLCLAEVNYLRTGCRSKGLLDAYLVTDEDIANRTGYAAKIEAVTDAAQPLPLGAVRD